MFYISMGGFSTLLVPSYSSVQWGQLFLGGKGWFADCGYPTSLWGDWKGNSQIPLSGHAATEMVYLKAMTRLGERTNYNLADNKYEII